MTNGIYGIKYAYAPLGLRIVLLQFHRALPDANAITPLGLAEFDLKANMI